MVTVKVGNEYNHMDHKQFMIKDVSELEELERTSNCAPGSVAFIPKVNATRVFILDEDNVWQEV